jgi:serine protease Do
VALRDVDPDVQRSLNLTVTHGALVEDVTEGSPGQRAGLRAYDVIVSLDDHGVANDDQLIREISMRTPGSPARIRLVRDGREQTITLKLAERPAREASDRKPDVAPPPPPQAAPKKTDPDGLLGLSVRDLDRPTAERLDLPRAMKGVLVTRVEPMSSSFDADVQRGNILLEINRQRIETVGEFRRLARAARPGDILTLYIYAPDVDQRQLKTIRVEER